MEKLVIYLDGENGNDAKDGLTSETAKKTWDAAVRAIELSESQGGTVRLTGPSEYTENVKLPGKGLK